LKLLLNQVTVLKYLKMSIKPIKTFTADSLPVRVFETENDMATDVANTVHDYLVETINQQGQATAILATGNSQIQFLRNLADLGGIDWSKMTLFHMDEYLGVDENHPACFRRYMRERVETQVKPRAFHYLGGDAPEPIAECERYESLLKNQPIDLCCMGVGENGHIAFNDPPVANFEDERLVKIVELDVACRMQQVNEGHFPNLEAVPKYALTLTVPALCSAKKIICVAPEARKAKPVKALIEGPISTDCPASYLRTQPQATLYVDKDSTKLLQKY
jgi:glucosamine-6-phosphate deaminase